MKVYVGLMPRAILERGCGCKLTQDFKDQAMKEPDGEAIYKPCAKHKRGAAGEIIQELMTEFALKEAEDYQNKQALALAQSNEQKVAPQVAEGATSETRTSIKVGGRVVQRPADVPAASAAPAPINAATGRRDPTKVRTANLSAGSAGGLRRAGAPGVAAAGTPKIASRPAPMPANSIDAELAGVQTPAANEDPRITKHLVDSAGGLLGPEEDDPSSEIDV